MEDNVRKIIEKEMKGCFDYFWYESNTDLIDGFGLTKDKTTSRICSIAAIGFAFCAYVIGVERGYISFREGYERVLKTLNTLKRIETHHGFFPHFIDPILLKRYRSEYSTIDTTILFCGGVVAGEYFRGEVKQIINGFINDLDWNYFLETRDGKKQINMAYSPKIWQETKGFCPATWDQYAEQLMMYLLIAGEDKISKDEAIDLFNGFTRHKDKYYGIEVIHCFANPLFIHQFSHAFFPFQDYLDTNSFDWFKNSINACRANRLYCINQKRFKTYGPNSWGLTAFLGEDGYKVFGSKPFGLPNIKYKQKLDGSVAPYAALCSINFIEEEVIDAIKYFDTIPNLFGKYGFTDSYNLDTGFVSDVYIGIDKGPTIVMLDNYLNGTTWKYFTQSEIIKKAIDKLNFKKKEKKNEN